MAQSCPQRKDPGGKLVLLGAVTAGSCALTRMSRRLEVRLSVSDNRWVFKNVPATVGGKQYVEMFA